MIQNVGTKSWIWRWAINLRKEGTVKRNRARNQKKLVQRPYIYVSFWISAGSGANGFAINGSTFNTYVKNQSSVRLVGRPVSRRMSKNPSFGPLDFPL